MTDDEQFFAAPPEMASLGPQMLEHAQAKFPEEYARIIRKFGALQFVWGENGNLDGLEEPVEYLEYSDRLELGRLTPLKAGLRPERTLTSKALRGFAEGESSRYLAQWERFKQDPDYVCENIRAQAALSDEQLPTSLGGSLGATPEELLAKSRYVCMRFRFTAHNIALKVAMWSCIVGYLRDVEALDAKMGRFGDRETRGRLMSMVKQLLDGMQEAEFRRFRKATMMELSFRLHAVKVKQSQQEYGGGELNYDAQGHPGFPSLTSRSHNLSSVLLRMLLIGDDPHFQKEGLIDDVGTSMDKASLAEKSCYSVKWMDTWSALEIITRLIVLLGTDGEDWQRAPQDERFRKHAEAGRLSELVFEGALFEKHVKSVESLRSPTVLKKIWAEIDKISLKKARCSIDKVLALKPVLPSWTHDPPPEVPEALSSIPSFSTPQRRQPVANQSRTEVQPIPRPPTPEVRPVGTSGPAPPRLEVPAARKEAKVKTKGVAGASPSTPGVPPADGVTGAHVLPVGQRSYEILEKLLVRCDMPVKWIDVEYALCSGVGFGKTMTGGSTVIFSAPGWAQTSRTFHVDRPHPGTEVSPIDIRGIGKRLVSQYGLSMAGFSPDKRRSGNDE